VSLSAAAVGDLVSELANSSFDGTPTVAIMDSTLSRRDPSVLSPCSRSIDIFINLLLYFSSMIVICVLSYLIELSEDDACFDRISRAKASALP